MSGKMHQKVVSQGELHYPYFGAILKLLFGHGWGSKRFHLLSLGFGEPNEAHEAKLGLEGMPEMSTADRFGLRSSLSFLQGLIFLKSQSPLWVQRIIPWMQVPKNKSGGGFWSLTSENSLYGHPNHRNLINLLRRMMKRLCCRGSTLESARSH